MDFQQIPIHTLTINQIVKLDYAEFIDQLFRTGFQGTIKYVDGIILIHFTVHDTVETVRDEISGLYHWSYVEFAKCENYIKELILNENKHMALQVIDVSTNPLFPDFVRWLKTQKIWNDES